MEEDRPNIQQQSYQNSQITNQIYKHKLKTNIASTNNTQPQDQQQNSFGQIRISRVPRMLLNPQSHDKMIFDGFDFQPVYSIGISSQQISLDEEGQIVYITGNHYVISNVYVQFKMTCLNRKGDSGGKIVGRLLSIKNKKGNAIACTQLVNNQQKYANVNVYDRISNISHKIRIHTTGTPKDIHLFLQDKLGVVIFDEGQIHKPKFSICLFDYERQNLIQMHERNNKPIKIIASNFGDFTLILCEISLYQIQFDNRNRKIQLVQFQTRRYLQSGQFYIDANFLKNTIKLVMITNLLNIFIFQGPILIYRNKLQFPIIKIIPFQDQCKNLNALPKQQRYQQNIIPQKLQTSQQHVYIQFQDNQTKQKKLGVWKLIQNKDSNKQGIVYDRSYNLQQKQYFKDRLVKNIYYVNGDIVFLTNKNNILELWRIVKKSVAIQDIQQISTGINFFNYLSKHDFICVDACITQKLIATIHEDHFIRLWNFQTKLLYKQLSKQKPLQLSMHPFGYYLAVRYNQLARFYIIKQNQLDLVYTLKLKNLSALRYSPNGNFLIIITNSKINVLNAYSYDTINIFTTSMTNINQIRVGIDQICLKNSTGQVALHELVNGQKLFNRRQSGQVFDLGQGFFVSYFSEGKKRLKIIKRIDDFFYQKQLSLANRKILMETENITFLKVYAQLGLLFMGTSDGNIIEIIWESQQQLLIKQQQRTHSNQDDLKQINGIKQNKILDQHLNYQFYKYRACQSPIIFMKVQQNYEKLLLVTRQGLIITLRMQQYLEGFPISGVYVFKKNQLRFQGLNNRNKRTHLNRSYLFQRYMISSKILYQKRQQDLNEAQFMKSNRKIQVYQQRNKNSLTAKKLLTQFEKKKQQQINNQKKYIQEYKTNHLQRKNRLLTQSQKLTQSLNQQTKIILQDLYEQSLLKIISRSNQLLLKKQMQQKKLNDIYNQLKNQNNAMLEMIKLQKKQQYQNIKTKFFSIQSKGKKDDVKMQHILKQINDEEKMFRKVMEEQLQQQLKQEDQKKDQSRLKLSKHQKQIRNLIIRHIHLENLIQQTHKQIKQLQDDRNTYQLKAKQLKQQLRGKQDLINVKQQQIKTIFTQNQKIQSFKQMHQYLLRQYQKQQLPNQLKRNKLDFDVKFMNQQLISQINWKHAAQQRISEAIDVIQQMQKQKSILLAQKTRSNNLVQQIKYNLKQTMHSNPPQNWNYKLKNILKTYLSEQNTYFKDKIYKYKSDSKNSLIQDVLIKKQQLNRKINLIKSSLANDQKSNQLIISKYQIQNNTLLKQHTQLVKQQRSLLSKLTHLKKQINKFQDNKKQIKVSQSQIPSQIQSQSQSRNQSQSQSQIYHKIKKSINNPTPFQKYIKQQEMTTQAKDTSRFHNSSLNHSNSVKLPPLGSSQVWVKSVIRDANKIGISSFDTTQLLRQKIRSFVNPQLYIPTNSKKNIGNQYIIKNKKLNQQLQKINLQKRQFRVKSQANLKKLQKLK